MSTAPFAACLIAAAGLAANLPATGAAAPAANDGLFARLDANADGQLEAAEVGEEHRRLFDRLLRRADADQDQRLTAAEFAAGLTPSTAPKPIYEAPAESNPAVDALRLLLLKLDTNADTLLTREEAPAELADAFDQLCRAVDGDKNGQIAYRELVQEARPASRAATQIVRRQGWDVAAELRRLDAQQGAAAKRFNSQPNPRAMLASTDRTADLFQRLDSNADGELTVDELPEEGRERLERLVRAADRDRSGGASLEEFQRQSRRAARVAGMAETRQADEQPPMMSPDQPAAEPNALPAVFQRMDADANGQITRSEAAGPLRRLFPRVDANGDQVLDARELRRAARALERRRASQPE